MDSFTSRPIYRNEEAGVAIDEVKYTGGKSGRMQRAKKKPLDALTLADMVYARFKEGATLEQVKDEIRMKEELR